MKNDRIDASGVSTLMNDVGLTNGAFDAHFTSRDDLVGTVVADLFGTQAATLAALPEGRAALEKLVRDYPSPDHRDHPADGCPGAALLDEISRRGPAIRDAYTAGEQPIVDVVAAHLCPEDPSAARTGRLGLLTAVVPTLKIALAVSDPPLSDEILTSGIANTQAVIDHWRIASDVVPDITSRRPVLSAP